MPSGWRASFPTTSPRVSCAGAARTLRTTNPLAAGDTSSASDHALAESSGLEPILRLAADRFPAVRSALNAVSDRVFFPVGASSLRIERQFGGNLLQ